MSSAHPAQQASFMVFSLDGAMVGVSTAAVESVLADPDQPAASTETDPHSYGRTDSAPRLLILGPRKGVLPKPLRTSGALQVVELSPAQVVALPRLCKSPGGAISAVAILEEQVLFLIMDPYRLAIPSGRIDPAGSDSAERPQ